MREIEHERLCEFSLADYCRKAPNRLLCLRTGNWVHSIIVEPLLADGSSAAWEYLQANKRWSATPAGIDEVDLAAGYDIVVLPDPGPGGFVAADVDRQRPSDDPHFVARQVGGVGVRCSGHPRLCWWRITGRESDVGEGNIQA